LERQPRLVLDRARYVDAVLQRPLPGHEHEPPLGDHRRRVRAADRHPNDCLAHQRPRSFSGERRLCQTRTVRLDRLRAALDAAGHTQAVLSHPETLASLGCFETPDEDWPVANPFVTVPALFCISPGDAVLVVADFHAPDVPPTEARVVTYRSYDFRRAPDPAGELRTALLATLDEAGFAPGAT